MIRRLTLLCVLLAPGLLSSCRSGATAAPLSNPAAQSPPSAANPTPAAPLGADTSTPLPTAELPVQVRHMAALGLAGEVLYTQGPQGVWSLQLASGEANQVFRPEPDGYVDGVAVEPGSGRLALSYSATSSIYATHDLYLYEPGAAEPVLLRQRTFDYEDFIAPVFHPQTGWLYYTRMWLEEGTSGSASQFHLVIERMLPQAGAEAQVILEEALQASFSADGEIMAFIRVAEASYARSLWIASPYGTGAEPLVGDGEFIGLYGSQISPAGDQVVFAAYGRRADPPAELSLLDRLLGVTPASAHGLPWDLWLVDRSVSQPVKLTDLYLDDPWPAWSPDSDWILSLTAPGLLLTDLQGRTQLLLNAYGHGGVIWLP